MKKVQQALASTGIPTFALAWKPTSAAPTAPEKYIVYTTMRTEVEHWDDAPCKYEIYVYLNFWTCIDPTSDAETIRKAMRSADFGLVSESDSFQDDTGYILVASTWAIPEEVEQDGA